MRRDLEKDLIRWKSQPQRMPLLVWGARQVGKTYLVRDFGKRHFKKFLELNFEQYPEMAQCFISRDPSEIARLIELMLGETLEAGNTLLFLDEIQECPEAIISLRYFKEQMPNLHIIGAGSLLEFILNDEGFRMPVGRVQFLYLHPLSFGEFLDAAGQTSLRDYLKSAKIDTLIPTPIHEKCLKLLKEYVATGGMPAALLAYLEHKDRALVQEIQSSLLMGFRRDFGKYSARMPHVHLETIFSKTPGLIGKWLKYATLNPDVAAATSKSALTKLCHAGLIIQVFATSATGLPLITHQNEKKCKLLFLDIGLVKRSLGLKLDMLLSSNLMLLNEGALAEQLVGQELLAYFGKEESGVLYAWAREARGSSAEVDYLLPVEAEIVPIEVKSGANGKLRSLHMLMKDKKLPIGIKISQQPLGIEGNILSIPLYMIESLPRLVIELRQRKQKR